MKTLLAALALALTALSANANQPTVESVKTLLEVTKTEAMIDQAYASVEQFTRQGIAQETAGKNLTDEQRRVIERAPAKVAEVVRSELSWAKMQPIYIAIYQEAFTQAEIDGLIEFYKGPVGQSFIAKMPIVMNRSMQVMQSQMQMIMPKLKVAIDDVLREAKLPPKT
jgi:hypothetical protein